MKGGLEEWNGALACFMNICQFDCHFFGGIFNNKIKFDFDGWDVEEMDEIFTFNNFLSFSFKLWI